MKTEQIKLMVESLEELNETLGANYNIGITNKQNKLLEYLKQVKKLTIPVVSTSVNCDCGSNKINHRCENCGEEW